MLSGTPGAAALQVRGAPVADDLGVYGPLCGCRCLRPGPGRADREDPPRGGRRANAVATIIDSQPAKVASSVGERISDRKRIS